MISALEGKGIDELLEAIQKELPPTRKKAKLLIPFSAGSVAAQIRRDGAVEQEEYTADGLMMTATVDIDFLERYKDWVISIL